MAIEVDICNIALANLGDTADVTSIDPPEGSAQAERCAQYYPLAVRALLEAHEWNFATRREKLAAFSTNDRGDWLYKYALPAKCLKIISLDFEDTRGMPPEMAKGFYDFEIAVGDNGLKALYTNIENAAAKYIAVVGAEMLPTLAMIAVAWKLSSFLAGSLIKGSEGMKVVSNCDQMFSAYLQQAVAHDARQHREWREQIPEWIAGR